MTNVLAPREPFDTRRQTERAPVVPRAPTPSVFPPVSHMLSSDRTCLLSSEGANSSPANIIPFDAGPCSSRCRKLPCEARRVASKVAINRRAGNKTNATQERASRRAGALPGSVAAPQSNTVNPLSKAIKAADITGRNGWVVRSAHSNFWQHTLPLDYQPASPPPSAKLGAAPSGAFSRGLTLTFLPSDFGPSK